MNILKAYKQMTPHINKLIIQLKLNEHIHVDFKS